MTYRLIGIASGAPEVFQALDDDDNPPAEDKEILAYLSRRQEEGDLQKAAYVFIGDDQMPSRLREI